MFISIAMYAEICSDNEQAFDNMSKESEKITIVKKSLRPVSSPGKFEQAKKTWRLQTPSKVTEDTP